MGGGEDMEQKKTTVADVKAAQREYQRRWRREHPEKTREYNQRYWAKKTRQQSSAECAQDA